MKTSIRTIGCDPPPVRHRGNGGDRPAVPEVREDQPHRIMPQASISKYTPDPEGPDDRSRPGTGGPLLQLAQRAGRITARPVVLRADQEGGYGEGMTIPADALQRKGYRLPTEAEWSTRAGLVRHKSVLRPSTELLPLCLVPGQQRGPGLALRQPLAQRSGPVRYAGERV